MWHKNELLLSEILKSNLAFRPDNTWPSCAVRERLVQQPLSAGSIISAACVSVMVEHICNKVVDSSWLIASFANLDDK